MLTGLKLVMTLLRVLTNREDAEGYRIMFEAVSNIVQTATGEGIQFRYLHGIGVKSIVADMDRGQMQGMNQSLISS